MVVVVVVASLDEEESDSKEFVPAKIAFNQLFEVNLLKL